MSEYISPALYALRHDMCVGQTYRWLRQGRLEAYKDETGRWQVKAVQPIRPLPVSSDRDAKRTFRGDLGAARHNRLDALVASYGGTTVQHVRKALDEYLDRQEALKQECATGCEANWHPGRRA